MSGRLRLVCLFIMCTAVFMGTRARAEADGAILIRIQTPCHFFDGDGNWTLAIGDCDFQIVATPGLEVVNVTARGIVPASSSGAGARWDFANTGLPCVIDGTPYSTTRWQETVTSNGEVAMHCD